MARPTSLPSPTPPFLDADRLEIRELTRLFEQKPLTLPHYYAAGEQLAGLIQDPSVTYRGNGWRKLVARAVGVSESTLNKCLQFKQHYLEKDLAAVERLKVGWGRLTIALGVKDRRERHRLLRQAAEENWDDQTLQRAIQKQKGTRRGGGRPRKEAKSLGLQPDLTRVIGLTDPWSDFYSQVWSGRQEAYRAEMEGLTNRARATLAELLAAAAQKLQVLRRQCVVALAQVKALQGGLPPDEWADKTGRS